MAPFLPLSALNAICLQSMRKNQKLEITGFLVEFEGVFLQALEGESDVVDELFARIAIDTRHRNVELLIREQRDTHRNFDFWAMNFGPLDSFAYWREVFDKPVDPEEFRRWSHSPEFALEILSRAYRYACAVTEVDPLIRDFVHGRVPFLDHA